MCNGNSKLKGEGKKNKSNIWKDNVHGFPKINKKL